MGTMIGLTVNFDQKKYVVKDEYINAILEVGSVPLLFPYSEKLTEIKQMLDCVEGLLLTGGADINPFHYGESPLPQLQTVTPKRDRFEILLIKEALLRDLPILGICRGMHVLNVAAGGKLFQDITTQVPHCIQHYQNAPRNHLSHHVELVGGTKLDQLLGQRSIGVNSFHHQAVKDLGEGFQMAAKAPDGLVEAIEHSSHRFVMGVQWHPSPLLQNEPHANHLIQAFIKATQ